MTVDDPATSSQEPQEPQPRRRDPWHKRFRLGAAGFEATKRALFLGVLTLLMLIPLGMIENLVMERANRQSDVDTEIVNQWGGPQTVLGPVLVVPYRYVTEADDAASQRTAVSRLFFLPKHLNIAGDMKAERRAKSIYQVLVYNGTVKLTGSFDGLVNPRPDIPPEMIDWANARLLIGISDLSAIRGLQVSVAGKPPVAEDSLQPADAISSSLAAAAPLGATDIGKPVDFAVTIDLRGSGTLNFVPTADDTSIALQADWPNPDFAGRVLPDDHTITDSGFTARWSLGVLNRGFPSSWRLGEVNPETLWNDTVGVALVEPGDVHQQTDRILKYGVLVIGLTFATIFVNGLIGAKARRVHPMQYLLVGAALCLFYLLLLSFAEQIGFGWAYLAASAVDIAMIAWYAWRTMSRPLGYLTALLLSVVQAYMYVLLQMEDYALISGTLALFAVLLVIMVATRNIDWYRIGREAEPRVS